MTPHGSRVLTPHTAAPRATAPTAPPVQPDVAWTSINTLRVLAMEAVEQANSGHPGTPMALAPAAYLLWTRHLKHSPRHPDWADRDRFVLSCGHASMLLYSLLHLTGYDLSLDDIRALPPVGVAHSGPPGAGAHRRRGDHHRPPRPGDRQRRRHGDGGAVPRGTVQPPRRCPGRSPHLGAGERRRPDGGRRVRSRLARRPPPAGEAHRHLRRQQHHHRRSDRPRLLRGRRRPVRGVRLAGAPGGRWQRSRPPSTRR